MLTRPFPDALCHRCEHHRDVRTGRSWFVLCQKLATRYPPQPVRRCSAFVERVTDDDVTPAAGTGELPSGSQPKAT